MAIPVTRPTYCDRCGSRFYVVLKRCRRCAASICPWCTRGGECFKEGVGPVHPPAEEDP